MNIIIIDDSKINNKLMYNFFKYNKQINKQINNIIVAIDGLDAINKICRSVDKIDMVFIDNEMQFITGTSVIKLLREINFNKIIIGISDCAGDELNKFADSGIDYIFSKPFDLLKKQILLNFLNKNDIQRYPNKKLTLINFLLEWI